MKRALTLLLALCLLLCLAACSEGGKPTPETTAPGTAAPQSTAATETKAPETEAPTTAAPETELPTEPETTEANEGPNIRGRIEGNDYINEYLNLRITRPQGWIFFTDEQIALANNLSSDKFKDTDLADIVAQAGQAMDMMLSDGSTGSLNLILQPNQPMLEPYTDEQIFQLSEEVFKAQFNAAGWETKLYEPKTMQVGGEDKTVLHLEMDANGTALDEYQCWYRDGSDYFGVLTLALPGGTDPLPYLDKISRLN